MIANVLIDMYPVVTGLMKLIDGMETQSFDDENELSDIYHLLEQLQGNLYKYKGES